MRGDFYRTIGVIVAGVTALAGIAAAVHVVVSLPISGNKGPEWLAAIGTVGALIGTIWLSTAAERRRRREQMDSTLIAAAEFAMRIAVLKSALASVLTVLPRSLSGDPCLTYTRCAEILDDTGIWTGADLISLVHLPGHAAAQLAAIGVSVHWVKRALVQASKRGGDLQQEQCTKVCEILSSRLRTSIEELDGPQKQCLAFSKSQKFGR